MEHRDNPDQTAIMAERRANQFVVDVVLGAPGATYNSLQRGKALDPLPSALLLPEVTDLSKWWKGKHRYVDPEGQYVFVYQSSLYGPPVYHHIKLVSLDSIRSVWDLLDPKWKGKIIIRDPLASGTMRATFGLIIERGLKSAGDTGAGFAWLRRLDGQTKAYEQNPGIISEKIARQEALVTVWDLPDVLLSRSHGLPVGYVFPTSGTVVIEDGIAVVRGAKHLAAARAFVDFVGSVQMQLAGAREVYRLPARLDLPPDSVPEWVRDVRRRMVVADVDWNLLATSGSDWMRWWDQHVRGTGGKR